MQILFICYRWIILAFPQPGGCGYWNPSEELAITNLYYNSYDLPYLNHAAYSQIGGTGANIAAG